MTVARGIGPCECECNCPQDLRLKRGKRSRICWYCDIGQHPGTALPPLFPELSGLVSSPGHSPAVPPSASVAPQSSPGEARPEGVDLTAGAKHKARGTRGA